MESNSRVFLVHFLKKWKYLDFCLPELESLAEMFGVKAQQLYHHQNPKESLNIKDSPFVYVNLPNTQIAQQVQERSVLIKEFINVLSESTGDYEDLVKNVNTAELQKVIDNR